MNFFVMDKTRDGAQRAAGWSAPLAGSFHTTARFGRVTFLATAPAQPTIAPIGMPSTAIQQLVPPAPTAPEPAAQPAPAAPSAQPSQPGSARIPTAALPSSAVNISPEMLRQLRNQRLRLQQPQK
jgi:hypothetical protein